MRNIRAWWELEGRYYHRDIYTGIRNLIRWFPVIWKDRSWDDSYIWEILKTKLKYQSDYIGKRGSHLDAKRDAQKMMTCVRLIDKIKFETYQSEYVDYHRSEFNWIPCDIPEYTMEKFIEDDDIYDQGPFYKMEVTELSENFDDYFTKYPHAYKEVTKVDRYIFDNDTKEKIAMNMGHYMDKKANRILFKMLETYLKTWWD